LILVALTVVVATAIGIVTEQRTAKARDAARSALGLMLYALLPFVVFVNFTRVDLSPGAGVGLILAYLGVGLTGTLAWAIAHRALHLPRPTVGAIVCTVIIVNTGYLGLPMTVALLGGQQLPHAVAYDGVVSGPMTFTVGFAAGAAFGNHASVGVRKRLRMFVTRNPPLPAAIAGLLVPAAYVPAALVHASHLFVDALLPLGFFAVGVSLSTERRADGAPLLERPDRRVLLAVGLRFSTTITVLASAFALGVGIPSAYLLQSLMPSGISSLIVGHSFGLDQRLIATIIVWSTIVVLVSGLVIYLVVRQRFRW
jgi:predicted permease